MMHIVILIKKLSNSKNDEYVYDKTGSKTHARQQGETVRGGLQPHGTIGQARRDTLLL